MPWRKRLGLPQLRRLRPKGALDLLGINQFFPYKPFNRMSTIRHRDSAMLPTSRMIRRLGAGVLSIAWLAGSTALAAEQPKAWMDGWSIRTQGPYGFTSGGAPGSFFFQSTPGT